MIKKMFQRKKNDKSRHFISAQARYRNQKAYYSLGVFSLMLGLMFTVDQGFHELAIDSTLENAVLSKKEEETGFSPLTLDSSSSPTRSFVSNWMDREFDKTKTSLWPIESITGVSIWKRIKRVEKN